MFENAFSLTLPNIIFVLWLNPPNNTKFIYFPLTIRIMWMLDGKGDLDTMKALVAYGTRYGSTTDIANKIGEILKKQGADVDIINLQKERIKDISHYDLIIIGSGIKMGSWTKKALGFLKKFESELAGKRVAFFVSCMSAHHPDKREEASEKYLLGIARRYPRVKPFKYGLFGGLIDVNRYGAGTRFIMKRFPEEFEKDGIDVNKTNDFRNWDEIQKWAKELNISRKK
ncbi:MAG: flavodoxin domain-containing protein [Thermoplasmata archaeon]|nr:MAG: flavodoxin domain-containing protein [Thermoplasmata archaeon]